MYYMFIYVHGKYGDVFLKRLKNHGSKFVQEQMYEVENVYIKIIEGEAS